MSSPVLAAAQVGMSLFSASEGAKNQAKMSQLEMNAAANNTAAANAEYTRQQEELNRTSLEQKTDRQRAYEQDIGSIRVAAAEGMGSVDRFASQAGYLLGTDLSRIDANRAGGIDALQARKVAAAQDAKNTVQRERNKSDVATSNILFQTVGSGIQIGSDYSKQQTQNEILRNTRRAT